MSTTLSNQLFYTMHEYWLCYEHSPKKIKSSVSFFNINDAEKVKTIKIIFNQILIKYNFNNTNLLSFKDDTNIIVFVLDFIVIKVYSLHKYNMIKDIINITHESIEKTLEIFFTDNIVIVVNEKVLPLLTCTGDLNQNINWEQVQKEQIYDNITNALNKIHKLGYLHNDVSLDNIGLKIINKVYHFILFDFGASIKVSDNSLYILEFEKLSKSIYRYLSS